MKTLAKAGQWAFAICLIGLAGQQLYYSDPRPVFVPAWASPIPGHTLIAVIFSIILIGTAATLLLRKGVRIAMLALGSLLLALFIFSYLPFELLVDPNRSQLGAWNNALKELNISGGAFLIAGIPDARRLAKSIHPHGPRFFTRSCWSSLGSSIFYMPRASGNLFPRGFRVIFSGLILPLSR